MSQTISACNGGWNPIAEFSGNVLTICYTWGMDLSGSMQGAGGGIGPGEQNRKGGKDRSPADREGVPIGATGRIGDRVATDIYDPNTEGFESKTKK